LCPRGQSGAGDRCLRRGAGPRYARLCGRARTTGRPSYYPATLLKLYIYAYLNHIQSSRRLERECQRNVELIWLTERLAPDFKTIADFRRNNGTAICAACAQFIVICPKTGILTRPLAAIKSGHFYLKRYFEGSSWSSASASRIAGLTCNAVQKPFTKQAR
jgi:hypothetical protein